MSSGGFDPIGAIGGGSVGGLIGGPAGKGAGAVVGGRRGKGGSPSGFTPPNDPRIAQDINAFAQQLEQTNPGILALGEQLIAQGLGTQTDPLIEAQRQRAFDQQRGRLARSGITGSVAENQLNRLGRQFDELRLGSRGQQLQSGLGVTRFGLENLLAPATARTAALAARTGGTVNEIDSGKSGLFGKG